MSNVTSQTHKVLQRTIRNSSRLLGWGCTWSRGVYLVRGGCTWFRAVYLVPGGVPGSGGCNWSLGCTWPQRGVCVPGPGGRTWSGGCTWSQGGTCPGTSPCGQILTCKNITFATSLRTVIMIVKRNYASKPLQ